jgi:UDP-glucose 4-epimerase
MRRVAWVTGASGFLGGAVARGLIERGWTVVGTGRRRYDDVARTLAGLAGYVPGNLGFEAIFDAMEACAGPPAVVVHCAGAGTVAEVARVPIPDLHTTVMSLALLAQWLLRRAADARLLVASSAAVYGAAPAPQREDAAPAPVSDYGWHKLMGEQVLASARQKGLACCAVRFFSLFGPGLRKQVLWDTYWRARASHGALELSGNGAELRDLLYIDDAVALLHSLIASEGDLPPVVNGGTGRGARIGALMTMWSEIAFGGRPIRFTGAVRAADPAALVADIGLAASLGFAPSVPLEEGFRRTADWLQDTVAPPLRATGTGR